MYNLFEKIWFLIEKKTRWIGRFIISGTGPVSEICLVSAYQSALVYQHSTLRHADRDSGDLHLSRWSYQFLPPIPCHPEWYNMMSLLKLLSYFLVSSLAPVPLTATSYSPKPMPQSSASSWCLSLATTPTFEFVLMPLLIPV